MEYLVTAQYRDRWNRRVLPPTPISAVHLAGEQKDDRPTWIMEGSAKRGDGCGIVDPAANGLATRRGRVWCCLIRYWPQGRTSATGEPRLAAEGKWGRARGTSQCRRWDRRKQRADAWPGSSAHLPWARDAAVLSPSKCKQQGKRGPGRTPTPLRPSIPRTSKRTTRTTSWLMRYLGSISITYHRHCPPPKSLCSRGIPSYSKFSLIFPLVNY